MNNLKDLLTRGVVSIAKLPKDNIDFLDSTNYDISPLVNYTVTLLEHDYPARTPAMWNSVYRKLAMPFRSTAIIGNSNNCKEIFEVLRKDPRYFGGGLGVGFKEKSIKFLDVNHHLALQIGSINIVVKEESGLLKGYNTDGAGYATSLEIVLNKKGKQIRNCKIVILGAGGTANSIGLILAGRGAKIVILNRTKEKARDLASRINRCYDLNGDKEVTYGGEGLIPAEIRNADVIINTSTKGASGILERYSPLAEAKLPATQENIRSNLRLAKQNLKLIPKYAVISDIVLRDKDTVLIESAKIENYETLDGIPMVINQGVEAFFLIHGNKLFREDVTKETVRDIMEKAI